MEGDLNKRKDFWNAKHEEKSKDFLSGCEFKETIDFLQVNALLTPNLHILEVGVGLGYVTKAFYDNNILVSALEISDIALENVKKYCEHTYSVERLEELPTNYFDIIICHNLIQHIPTDLLITELTHILRSLKDDGIFAVEFISSKFAEDTGIKIIYDENQCGNYCRTPEYLEKLINNVGGKCEMVVNNKCNIDEITGCHVFHIRKQ